MKIERVHSYPLDVPLARPFAYSRGVMKRRSALLVEVITDDGVAGWGEAFGPVKLSHAAIDLLRPHLVGLDPRRTEFLWQTILSDFREHGRKGPIMNAASAVDIAIWDILGKSAGMPVHKLLGGPIRETVPAYASGLFRFPDGNHLDELPREAEAYVSEGYAAMKMKVGYDVGSDAASVRTVRAAIGSEIDLMIDANEAYDTTAAIQLGRKIADQDIAWFEEPVPPDDLAGYASIKAALPMPIAGGEAEFNRFGFREIAISRCMDIVQPDICGAGGFTETKKIVDMTHAFGLRCHPHTWGTAVAIAASLQLLAVVPDSVTASAKLPPYLEMDRTEHPIRDALLPDDLRPVNGSVRIPDRPGLGLDIDRKSLEAFRMT